MPNTTVESAIEAELAARDIAPIAIVGPELADTDDAKINAGLAAFFRVNPDPSQVQVDGLIGSREDRRVYDRGVEGTYAPAPIVIPGGNLSTIEIELTEMNVYLDKLGVEITKLQVETDTVKLDDHLAQFVAANPMPTLYEFDTWNATVTNHLAYYRCVRGLKRMDDDLAVMGLKRH